MNRIQEKCWDCLCNLSGEEVLSILQEESQPDLMKLLSHNLQKRLEELGYLDSDTPSIKEE